MTRTATELTERDPVHLAQGDRLVSAARTITEADVVSFAALTGDRHPLHTDAVWAEQGPFGGRIAHGMLVLSYAIGLAPLDAARVVALRRVSDATFKSPVHPGDTIHVEGLVEDVRELDGGLDLVAWRWRIVDQRGRTAVRARLEVLWRREAEAPAEEGGAPGTNGAADEAAIDTEPPLWELTGGALLL
jgi:3-hydroxybutyryl-CoA dehydratase